MLPFHHDVHRHVLQARDRVVAYSDPAGWGFGISADARAIRSRMKDPFCYLPLEAVARPHDMKEVEWIRIDEAEEAVSALESVGRFLQDVEWEPLAWRWVIIGLHIAVQGFMVVALRDSAGLLPLRDDVAKKWLDAYRTGKPPPEERLDSFRNLYKKVKRKKTAEFLNATPFKPKGSQGRSIKLMGRLRDQFIHFLPVPWSLEVARLPQMCRDGLDFIEFLSHDYRTLLWHDEEHPARIESALAAARQALAPSGDPRD